MNKVGKYFADVFSSIGQLFSFSKVKLDKELFIKSHEDALRSDWEAVGEAIQKVIDSGDWLDRNATYCFKNDTERTPMKIVSLDNGTVRLQSENLSHVWTGGVKHLHEEIEMIQ